MKLKFRRILLLCILAGLLIWLGISIPLLTMMEEEKAAVSVLYTDHVITSVLQDILISLQRAESNRRGFVITKDRQYIHNYSEAVKAVEYSLSDLKDQNVTNIYQDKFLDSLTTIVMHKIGYLKLSIELYNDQKSSDSIQIALTNEGRITMTSIREIIEELLREKKIGTFDQFQTSRRLNANKRDIITVGLTILILYLIGIAIATLLYFRKILFRDEVMRNDLYQARQQVIHATTRYENLLKGKSE